MVSNRSKLLSLFTGVMMLAIFAANIAAVKLWNLFGIAVDGGLLVFPLTYIVGDLLVELYGRKTADWVSLLSTIANVAVVMLLWLVVLLPTFPGWEDQAAFQTVVFSSLRITFASLIAFLLSQFTNNWSFREIKRWQWFKESHERVKLEPTAKRPYWNKAVREEVDDGPALSQYREDAEVRHYKLRALLSSALGRLVDNAVFETIAFLGVLPFKDFLVQAGMAYVEGFVVETLILLFISQPLLHKCRTYISK